MSFFGNRDVQKSRNEEASRKRSAMNLAFNPGFGSSFAAVKESLYMFVKLLALIFAQAELIDKRHPVLTGADGRRYTVLEVIRLAHQRVVWRQENLPQTAVFVGVVGGLAIGGIALVIFALGGFMQVSSPTPR